MPEREQRERELKFDVPEAWRMPDVTELAPEGGSVERAGLYLESTYHDTADRDLLRARMTLRRRTGDADTGWHLKVPAGPARLELRLPLSDEDEVPEQLAAVTLGVRAGAPLAPVARLATERSVHRLVDAAGRAMAEIVVDEVKGTATGEAAVLSRWREVEVELAEGDEALLARVADWLVDSGARPATSASKLARALGEPVSRPPVPEGLGGLVARYVDEQYAAILDGDVALRRGRPVVHPTRVATRRYRSALRVFAEIMDADRAAALDAELRWFAEVLGTARDRQVLREHLDAALAELPPELVLGPVAARIHTLVTTDLAAAEAKATEAMASARYFALLRELRAWHEQPPLRGDVPAAEAERFVCRSKRAVRRRLGHAAEAADRDAAMHRVRKAAKRLRYAAELVEPELGGTARRQRKQAKRLQSELGQIQDHVVAAQFLLRAGRIAGTTPGENGFTFGLLYQRERAAADARIRCHLET